MPEIVGVGDGFTEVFVETQGAGERPCVLGHFQGMGETRPVKISLIDQKNLGFVLKILEDLGVEDAIPVPLKAGAVIVRFIAVKRPSRTVGAPRRVGGKLFLFRCFKKFPGCHTGFYLYFTSYVIAQGSLYAPESFCKQYIGKLDRLCSGVIKEKKMVSFQVKLYQFFQYEIKIVCFLFFADIKRLRTF
jgi:hypothetical protein